DQFVRAGESRQMPPGSYDIVVSAPGYLPTRMTVEALPAVTTRVRVSLLPETAAVLSVAARPWGTLFVDQERIGFTDIAGHRIAPGRHVVRLQRDQRRFRDTVLVVADREQVRLRWVDRHDATGDAQVDSALEMLDAGDVERAAELLGRLLAARAEAGGAARAAAPAHPARASRFARGNAACGQHRDRAGSSSPLPGRCVADRRVRDHRRSRALRTGLERSVAAESRAAAGRYDSTEGAPTRHLSTRDIER